MSPRAGASVLVAAMLGAGLIYMASEWDRSIPAEQGHGTLRPPPGLDPGALAPGEGSRSISDAGSIALESGAWVDIAGPNGQLAQRYTAARIDPEAGQWLRLAEPRAVFYQEGGGIVTLQGRGARVHVPSRALERGTFSGDVLLQVYRPRGAAPVDLALERPAYVFEAQEAQFDAALGTLVVPGEVRLTTDMLSFEGEDLELTLSPDRRRVERLTVARPLGPIVIHRTRADAGPAGAQPALRMVDDRAPFYLLTLERAVELLRYTPQGLSRGFGERMRAVFSLESELLDDPQIVRRLQVLPASREAAIALAALGGLQGAPREEDLLLVRYAGQLTLEPLPEGIAAPDASQDMRVWFDGGGCGLADPAGKALRCETMDFELGKDGNGIRPEALRAQGAVEATDGAQTLWGSSLAARFEPGPGEGVIGPASVGQVDAGGPVELRLREGARAFASGVDAQPDEGRARLLGPDVLLVRGNAAAIGLAELEVQEASRTASSAGPGSFVAFEEELIEATEAGMVGRPALPSVPQLRADWTESMRYQDLGEQGGILQLRGTVRARATPRPEEFDALDAQDLHLVFGRQGEAALSPAGSGIALQSMVARGGVRLENQVYADAARSGEPRLFRIDGERVEYDARTGEATVPCAGSVLVHNPVPEQAAAGQPSADGTTRFQWAGGMELRRGAGKEYRLSMTQGVQMTHAGLRPEDVMSMTGDHLYAVLLRSEAAADAASAAAGEGPVAGFGGAATLRRVRGVGRVMVRTAKYDMECEEFDYDTLTQVAQLTAKPGRQVIVHPKGEAQPMLAERVLWDLASGRIQLGAAAGAATR